MSKGSKNQRYLYRAMRKYGVDKFKISTLIRASSLEELNSLEVKFIKWYRSAEPFFGYNMTHGGDGVRPNEETRKKMSESAKASMTPARLAFLKIAINAAMTPEVCADISRKVKARMTPKYREMISNATSCGFTDEVRTRLSREMREAMTPERRQQCVEAGKTSSWQSKKTRDKHGHPFSKENTWVDSAGGRHCRICMQIACDNKRERRRLVKAAKQDPSVAMKLSLAEQEKLHQEQLKQEKFAAGVRDWLQKNSPRWKQCQSL